jgi:hypothetical protein
VSARVVADVAFASLGARACGFQGVELIRQELDLRYRFGDHLHSSFGLLISGGPDRGLAAGAERMGWIGMEIIETVEKKLFEKT